MDLDAAVTITYKTKSNKYICSIVKHNVPCGASIEDTQLKSYSNALAGDPVSAFGGVVALNKKVNINTAKSLVKNFYEVIAAPDFEKEALSILKNKRNLRVLKIKKFNTKKEMRSFFAGTLTQEINYKKSTIKRVFGVNKLTKEKIDFFTNVLKFVKSNAIALFDKTSLVSQSGGQTSRVDALQNLSLIHI